MIITDFKYVIIKVRGTKLKVKICRVISFHFFPFNFYPNYIIYLYSNLPVRIKTNNFKYVTNLKCLQMYVSL